MDSPERQIYRFEDVEVDVVRGTVTSGGEARRLRQKTFQVLVYLIENRAAEVSKDKIIASVWNDAAVVDDVLVQSVKDIRRALDDDAHNPRFIRTIPKYGYRFIGELAEPIDPTTSKAGLQQSPTGRHRRVLAIGIASVVILALMVLLGNWALRQEGVEVRLPQMAGKRAVAVMFFENQSKSTELEWLREGLADMLVAGLSRSPHVTVLSRNQLHLLLDRIGMSSTEKIGLDVAVNIARRANADVVIVGSYIKVGEKLRVDLQIHKVENAELIAVEGINLDSPDLILSEIDTLSLRVARGLGVGGTESEMARGLADVMTNNLEAYRYYSLGVEKAESLKNQEAIDLLEKAVTLDSDFAMAHARIGYTYVVTWGLAAKGKPYLEQAFRLSTRLTEKDRLNISAWYSLAHLDYPSAISSYETIIANYPAETEAYWRLGRLLLGEERYADALRVLNQGLVVDAQAKDLYNALGVTYRDMGQHADAITMSERYVGLAPEDPNAYDSLALAFQAAGQYDGAEAAYERSLALDPNFDVAILHLGNLYFQTGRYDKAIRSYESYIAAASSDWDKAWGWGRIAWVNRRRGRLKTAAAAAAKELKLDDTSFANSFIIALETGDQPSIERLKPKLDETSGYTERGLRPSLRWVYFLRGRLALKGGRSSEAIENFKKVLRHRPMIWDIDSFEDCLATAYLELDRFDEAITEYTRILQSNPNYPLARFHLGQASQNKGDIPQAVENYRLFLGTWQKADPDIPEIVTARKALALSP